MVRECVRNEIALQRSGDNSSLLMRTRDVIHVANCARSACQQVASAVGPSHSTVNSRRKLAVPRCFFFFSWAEFKRYCRLVGFESG